MRGKGVLSEILHVNREAREEATRFYRVHLPCGFTTVDPDSKHGRSAAVKGILLLNPDYDFVHVKPFCVFYQTSLASFLVWVKTCLDPRRIGIQNLALDLRCVSLCGNHRDLPQSWESRIEVVAERRRFVDAIESLQEVFFITTVDSGRLINPRDKYELETDEFIFNRSIPIHTLAPRFTRLPRDPRPIPQDDLRKVVTYNNHPQEVLRHWHVLLECLGSTACQARYSWLLSFDAKGRYVREIHHSKDAEAFIRREDDDWNERVLGSSISGEVDRNIACGRASPDVRTKTLDQAPQPAFGFWLFPLMSEGADEKDSAEGGAEAVVVEEEEESYSRVRDLSAYRPGLILADLD